MGSEGNPGGGHIVHHHAFMGTGSACYQRLFAIQRDAAFFRNPELCVAIIQEILSNQRSSKVLDGPPGYVYVELQVAINL